MIDWVAAHLPAIAGTALAFTCAVLAIFVDCHVTLAQRTKRVPIPIVRISTAWVLSVACGIAAGVAYHFTSDNGTTFLDSILALKQQDPVLRGVIVGMTVLVLIRSKVFSLKGADVGGEYIYNAGRSWVMRSVNGRWRQYKNRYNDVNLRKGLDTPEFQDQLIDQVRQALRVDDEDLRVFVDAQIKAVIQNRPGGAVDPNSQQWKTYYRTLINLALDYAGPAVFDWAKFDKVS